MLIATSIAGVVVAASLAAGAVAPDIPAPPPIVVNISAAPNVSASLVALVIAEVDAIFRSAGVSFIWSRGESTPTALRVAIGNEAGAAREGGMPLGWIKFADGRPQQEIYVSYANAEKLMEESRGIVVWLDNNMSIAERQRMLGRVMGRALAHELGHYLLATKAHTAKGLLKAVRSAQELFGFDRRRFQLEPAQRTQIAARLNSDAVIASRQAPAGSGRSAAMSR
jgi:hypothetical protein